MAHEHRSNNGGACVEVADLGTEVAIRDSKDRNGPVLVVTSAQWTEFTAEIRAEESARTEAPPGLPTTRQAEISPITAF